MQFVLQVAVEAENAKAAANQIPDSLTVISVNPRPQQQPQQGQPLQSGIRTAGPIVTPQPNLQARG